MSYLQHLPLSAAFGKLSRQQLEVTWHPLVDHMLDVAATFEALCECNAIRRALEYAAKRTLNNYDIARLSGLVFLHDLGKANAGFQAKRWLDAERPRWRSETGHSCEWLLAGHGIEAIALIDAAQTCDEALALLLRLPVKAMAGWGDSETLGNLLHASISHHGRPLSQAPDWFNARTHWRAHGDYDPGAQLDRIAATLLEFVPEGFSSGGSELPASPRFAHVFAGLVQLADWLGSDTRYFPYSEPGENRLQTCRGLAHEAVVALGLDAEDARSRLLELNPDFAAVFGGNAPYPTQAAMADDALGPVVVLEAETGSGKTEAALWRFLYLFKQGKVDSLYFALPTRVAASQAYRRVCEAIARAWPKGTPVVIRALSGYAAADGETFRPLPDFKALWSDEPSDAEAGRRWAAENAKRYLAAPIAVGTVDQALLGTLLVKHAHLRHALAPRSLLVIDEVHASDAYMSVLIEHLIAAQTSLGGHALLLSATLGATARNRYLAAGLRKPLLIPSLPEATALPYPAISDLNGLHETSGALRNKRVTWRCVDAIDDPLRVASDALEAAAHGARVLVIRNTVPAAVATLAALEATTPNKEWLFSIGDALTLHHSRFSREDRPLLDAAVEAQLGKQRPSGPMIVVGTQTLEQSLDLDADFLITDLCPMDVLLQRIGRLHRHARSAEERPTAYREAQVCVLTPSNGDLAPNLTRPRNGLGRFRDGGGVYADVRILEATRRLIEAGPQICIPADNRSLVESATHPEALQAIEALGEAWATHAQQIEGDTGAKKCFARGALIKFDKPFVDDNNRFPADLDIATRLGAADRVVEFEPPLPGPFGTAVRELPIRHHLLPQGLAPDALPNSIRIESGGFRFQLGNVHYRYSRLGLEKLAQTAIQE